MKQPISISAVLKDLPSDEELAVLFPHPTKSGQPYITHDELCILKGKIDGLSTRQIADKLNMQLNHISYKTRDVIWKLTPERSPGNLIIDLPVLQRSLGMDVSAHKKYSRLSELLEAMPSDEELKELYAANGYAENFTSGRFLTRRDLYIVQQRIAGRSYTSIGKELGVSLEAIRRLMIPIYHRLVDVLDIEIDVGQEVFRRKTANKK